MNKPATRSSQTSGPKFWPRILAYLFNPRYFLALLVITVAGGILVNYWTSKYIQTPTPNNFNTTNIYRQGSDSGGRKDMSGGTSRPERKTSARPTVLALTDSVRRMPPENVKEEIAVLAAYGGELEPAWGKKLLGWLSSTGFESRPVFNAPRLTRQDIDLVARGDLGAIRRSGISQSAYLCVLKYDMQASESEVYSGFKIMQLSADLVIIDTRSGRVIDYIQKEKEKYSGVSLEGASRRAEDSLLAYITRQPLNLRK